MTTSPAVNRVWAERAVQGRLEKPSRTEVRRASQNRDWPAQQAQTDLLELDLGAGFFQLLLGGFG
ncbi:MAG: hypothetical protein RJA29_2004, partial [Pseudomonadota bacterium]